MIVLRALWVWISFTTLLQRKGGARPKQMGRLVLATAVAGVRGTITLAGVMTFPYMANGEAFPGRDLSISIAGGVVILSLIVAGLFLPPLLRGLSMPDDGAEARDERRARKIAALEAIDAIEGLQSARYEDPDHPHSIREIDWMEAAARISSDYRDRIDAFESTAEAKERRLAVEDIEHTITKAALAAEREVYFRLARERKISDALSRRLVLEVDQADIRLQAAHAH